jgi:hypothetical protein
MAMGWMVLVGGLEPVGGSKAIVMNLRESANKNEGRDELVDPNQSSFQPMYMPPIVSCVRSAHRQCSSFAVRL